MNFDSEFGLSIGAKVVNGAIEVPNPATDPAFAKALRCFQAQLNDAAAVRKNGTEYGLAA